MRHMSYDAQAEASTENYCYLTAYLPAAGMKDVAAATLTIGDTACTLK